MDVNAACTGRAVLISDYAQFIVCVCVCGQLPLKHASVTRESIALQSELILSGICECCIWRRC